MQLSRTRSTDSILVLMINERKNYVTENRFFKSVVIKKKGRGGTQGEAAGGNRSVGENMAISRAIDPLQNEQIG